MSLIVYLVALGALVSLSSAANITVASSNEEYVAAWLRKFQNDIKSADLQIACMDSRGADSVSVLNDQQEEIIREIQRFEESLVSVDVLSLIRRHCVQKYRSRLITYDTAKAQFSVCTSGAQTRVTSLTVNAKSDQVNQVAAAKVSANVNLQRAITSCNTTHFANPTKLEECVTSTMAAESATISYLSSWQGLCPGHFNDSKSKIDAYSTSIEANLRSVDKNLDASLCSTTDLARDAIKCSYLWEKNVLLTMGRVKTLFDVCMGEAETVCPCARNLIVGNDTIIATTTAAPNARNLIMGTTVAPA